MFSIIPPLLEDLLKKMFKFLYKIIHKEYIFTSTETIV